MKAIIEIQNLKCGGCENTVRNKLEKLKHITNVKVDAMTASVSFDYKEEKDIITIKKNLNKLGYPIAGHKNEFLTKTKSYVSCALGRLSN